MKPPVRFDSVIEGECPECGSSWRMDVQRVSGHFVVCALGHEYLLRSVTRRLNGPTTVEIAGRTR